MNQEKKGYGLVYQNVMRDKSITPEAKVIYAYLACFAGSNEKCYPSIQLILTELNMSKTRFYKHMALLIDKGIVLKQQEKQGNRFFRNTYIINSFPSFEDTYIGDTQIEDTQNLTTNNNSIKINSINNNSKKNIAFEKKHKYGEYNNVLLKDSELEKLNADYGEEETKEAIRYLDEYIEMSGKKYNNHNLVLRKWVFDAVKKQPQKKNDELEVKEKGVDCYSTDYYKQFM